MPSVTTSRRVEALTWTQQEAAGQHASPPSGPNITLVAHISHTYHGLDVQGDTWTNY
jgi:hypothetical protein